MRIAISLHRLLLLVLLLGIILLLTLASVTPVQAQTQPPPGTPVPTPGGGGTPTPSPVPTATPPPNPIQQIFHTLLFPAETISQALANVFTAAAEQEAESLSAQAGDWALLLGQVVQAPAEGYYQTIAEASLPVAAALAPALFLLRLALYHWRRLVGDDDSALTVIGDWVAAGALAVAAGPFLDLLTQLGWWIAGAALGETAALAQEFVQATTVWSVVGALVQVSLFSGILIIGVVVGGILAMAGMLFAFAAAQAALYVMAVLAAPLAVAGVLRHMRWLRSLWLKAVAVLALLPVVAGGVFKAGVALSTFFSGGGLLSILIRLLWLWGATGFLLALAGILGRVTLSASIEALGKLTGAVKGIMAIAALASLAGGGGGAAAGTAGGTAGGLAGGGSGGGGVGFTGPSSGGPSAGAGGALPGMGAASGGLAGSGGNEQALAHLGRAQVLTQKAGTLGALGLHGPAGYARTQARLEELAARKSALAGRLARFAGMSSWQALQAGQGVESATAAQGGEGEGDRVLGFSGSVAARLRSSFPGSEAEFQEGFHSFAPYIAESGLDPAMVAQTYPEDTARMVHAYLEDPQGIERAADPLQEAVRRGGAEGFLRDVVGTKGEGRPAFPEPPRPPMDTHDPDMDVALVPPGAPRSTVLDGVAGDEGHMPAVSLAEPDSEGDLQENESEGDREEPK